MQRTKAVCLDTCVQPCWMLLHLPAWPHLYLDVRAAMLSSWRTAGVILSQVSCRRHEHVEASTVPKQAAVDMKVCCRRGW